MKSHSFSLEFPQTIPTLLAVYVCVCEREREREGGRERKKLTVEACQLTVVMTLSLLPGSWLKGLISLSPGSSILTPFVMGPGRGVAASCSCSKSEAS